MRLPLPWHWIYRLDAPIDPQGVCRLALPMLKDAAEEVRIGAKRVPAELLSQYVLASVPIGTYAVWRLALYEPATPQVVALPRE